MTSRQNINNERKMNRLSQDHVAGDIATGTVGALGLLCGIANFGWSGSLQSSINTLNSQVASLQATIPLPTDDSSDVVNSVSIVGNPPITARDTQSPLFHFNGLLAGPGVSIQDQGNGAIQISSTLQITLTPGSTDDVDAFSLVAPTSEPNFPRTVNLIAGDGIEITATGNDLIFTGFGPTGLTGATGATGPSGGPSGPSGPPGTYGPYLYFKSNSGAQTSISGILQGDKTIPITQTLYETEGFSSEDCVSTYTDATTRTVLLEGSVDITVPIGARLVAELGYALNSSTMVTNAVTGKFFCPPSQFVGYVQTFYFKSQQVTLSTGDYVQLILKINSGTTQVSFIAENASLSAWTVRNS